MPLLLTSFLPTLVIMAGIGHITREHGDVAFWVERVNADRSKAVLVTAGANALATQPPTEPCEFNWRGIDFSTAYFDRLSNGAFSQPDGRWSDWLFPPNSIEEEPVTLEGFRSPAILGHDGVRHGRAVGVDEGKVKTTRRSADPVLAQRGSVIVRPPRGSPWATWSAQRPPSCQSLSGFS